MGGCISRRSSSAVAAADKIQVVHLNGHVQLFHTPTTARQVAGKHPPPAEYFVTTAAMLLSAAASPALSPNAVLQPGKVYFMLPFSTLLPEVSPADLSSIARRLTAAAKSAAKTGQSRPCMVDGGRGDWKAPAAAARSRQWRPLLETIKERPVNNNQRSHSDLQDIRKIDCMYLTNDNFYFQ